MKYDDIIHYPHHVSEKHPRMSRYDRAAQFSAFAALTGHEAAIRETARLTQARVQLEEDSRNILDEKLHLLRDWVEKQGRPVLCITYYQPDAKKSGGKYITAEGKLKKIKEYEKVIVLEDGREISMGEIIEMTWNESKKATSQLNSGI